MPFFSIPIFVHSLFFCCDKLVKTVFYRHGFWFSDTGAIAEIDPVKSVGVRVGYRFKVLDKLTLKRKRKIDCPKL